MRWTRVNELNIVLLSQKKKELNIVLYPIKSTEYVSGEKAARRVASTGREGVRRVGSHREKKTGTTDRSMTREMWTHGVNPIKSTAYVRLKKVARRVASTGRAGVRVATEKKGGKCRQGAHACARSSWDHVKN
jgi:hypothetical protein